MKRPARRATAAVTAIALAALALGTPLAHAQAAPAAPATTAAVVSGNAPPVPQDARQREYLIGAGDVLRVAVYQNPDLAIETRVSDTGQISFPLLGQVTVGGLTVPQVEKALADGLRTGNFVKQPQVTVLVTQVRGNQASALGMVNRPGRFPIDVSGMRLSELLAQAGGIAPGGSDVVILTGIRNGQPYRLQVDIAALFANGAQSQDPVVLNGDTIYVERMPTVYIYGEVQRPGAIRLENNMTLMQALASGGGLTQRGTTRGLRVHRRNGEGRVEELQPGMNDALQNGDVIYIRESLF
ncbi:polysaccharide export protein EpsE [Rhizobacter sp. SG703]|uniref:polysaccharide export protein EpsE n=1 Tax=Rhizobacter sp. SG703 TaxID=2587140 RepID=UPI0017ED4166|nr:polysaccharide export protein EpsE [Rhizobacter sp. SG703]NKI93042.1 polysaccharide export outer membrane protein [Rhizobacter sp. SG703]